MMMDGSLMTDGKTPASYEYNVEITRRVCEMSHPVGVSVEGELGCLGSLETGNGKWRPATAKSLALWTRVAAKRPIPMDTSR